MSPSESQLRAALREGAGGSVDADLIIARAQRYRRARRQRIGYAAAAVVVTAFIGVGGTLLANSGSGGESASSDAGRAATGGAAYGASRPAASPPGSSAGHRRVPAPETAACPTVPVPVVVPGSRRGERGGQLLPAHPATITACGYPMAGQGARHAVFGGAQAQTIATTLNAGSIVPTEHSRPCAINDDRVSQVVLLPADAGGRRARPVLVAVRCGGVVATNGVTARYLAVVPALLDSLLR